MRRRPTVNSHGIHYITGHRALMRATDDEAAIWPLERREEWWQALHPVVLYLQAQAEVRSGTGRYVATADLAEWLAGNTGHPFARECDPLVIPRVGAARGEIERRVAWVNQFIEEARRRQ